MFESRDDNRATHSSSNRVWWVVLSLLLTQICACSSRSAVNTRDEQEQLGQLTLPLTYESASDQYRLAASFLLFDHEVSSDTADEPLLTLLSARPPERAEPEAKVKLPPGVYWIVLRDWRLYRAEDETWSTVDAEPTTELLSVTVLAGETSTARFTFVTAPAPAPEGGDVEVTFEVVPGSLCGNGVTEAEETCDDGLFNGLPNKCNATCSGQTGPAPLRVAPDAELNGSGTSWADPMNDLQAALDQQSEAGGGAVWVLGGSFTRLTSNGETLIDVPGNVSLLGGFSGVEATPDQRDPDHERTWLKRAEGATPVSPLLQISGVDDVLLERIAIAETGGNQEDATLVVDGSSGVVLRNVTTEANGIWSHLFFGRSKVHIEQSNLNLTGVIIAVNETDLAIVETTLSGGFFDGAPFGGGYLYAVASRVLLQDVVSDRPLSLGDGNKVFLNRTIVRGRFDRTNMINSTGELTLVGSALLDTRTGLAPITATSLFVFDSTFAGLDAAFIGGYYSGAAAIEADSVEVALSTFFQSICGAVPHPPGICVAQVSINNEGIVHNTLFAGHEQEFPGPDPLTPLEASVEPLDQQSANCATFDTAGFERSLTAPDRVLATNHPCIDAGDAELLEASRQRLFTRVAEFLEPPFNADMARYEDPDFWRHSTVRTDTSEDTGAPDPGRHWEVTAP